MNFDLSRLNPVYTSKTPAVGNVYVAQGGGKNAAKFWIVVAIRDDACKLLGIDTNGAITSTASYYSSVMDTKPLIGWCPGVMELNLEVEGIPA